MIRFYVNRENYYTYTAVLDTNKILNFEYKSDHHCIKWNKAKKQLEPEMHSAYLEVEFERFDDAFLDMVRDIMKENTKDVLTACFDNGDKTMVVIFKDVYVVPLQHYQLATDGSASVGESHNEFKLIGGVKEW